MFTSPFLSKTPRSTKKSVSNASLNSSFSSYPISDISPQPIRTLSQLSTPTRKTSNLDHLPPSKDQIPFQEEFYSEWPESLLNLFKTKPSDYKSGKIDEVNYCSVFVDSTLVHWNCNRHEGIKNSERIFELPTKYHFSANLTCTVSSTPLFGDPLIGVLTVSREGKIFYYPERETRLENDLQLEDEVYAVQMIDCKPAGFVVGTSSGQLYQIQPSESSLKIQKMFRPPEGWLNRVLSWGKNNQIPITALLQGKPQDQGREVFVLSELFLERWILYPSKPAEMVLSYPLLEAAEKKISSDQTLTMNKDFQLKLLDFKEKNDDSFLILIALAQEEDFELRMLELNNLTINPALQSSLIASTEDVKQSEKLSLAHLEFSQGEAYIYYSEGIFIQKIPSDIGPIDLQYEVIGSGSVGNKTFFLIPNKGVISFSQLAPTTTFDQSRLESLNSVEISKQLLQAFREYQTGKLNNARALVRSLSQRASPQNLEAAALEVSRNCLDAPPFSDPTWAEQKSSSGISSASSLIISHQLDEKRKKHASLLEFFDDLNRFSYIKFSSQTSMQLGINNEKIAAAISLRQKQNSSEKIPFLQRLIKTSKDDMNFYSAISEIDKILFVIDDIFERNPSSDIKKNFNDIREANLIFEGILNGLSAKTIYYLPKLQDVIERQIQRSFEHLKDLSKIRNVSEDDVIFSQLSFIAKKLLEALSQSEEIHFQRKKKKIIKPFIKWIPAKAEEYAVNFREFESLAELCKRNEEKLHYYMASLGNTNFPECLFKSFFDEGETYELLFLLSDYPQLREFLRHYPHISWINDIGNGFFHDAALTLYEKADQETDATERRKILFSLSKLSALAVEEPSNLVSGIIDKSNQQLQAIAFQPPSSIPLPPKEVVMAQLTDPLDEKKVIEACALAKQIWGLIQDREIFTDIWKKVFEKSKSWKNFANRLSEIPNDQLIEKEIKDTILFASIRRIKQEPELRGTFDLEILGTILREANSSNDQIYSNLLFTIFDLVQREWQ